MNIAYLVQPQEQAMNSIPEPRGALTSGMSLAELTWLRVGGPADFFFQQLLLLISFDDLRDSFLVVETLHLAIPLALLSILDF